MPPLEYYFRRSGAHLSQQGGFIDHYLIPLVYPPGLTRTGEIALGLLVVAGNIAIYGLLLLRKRRNFVASRRLLKKDGQRLSLPIQV